MTPQRRSAWIDTWQHWEMRITGVLPAPVRRNFHFDATAALLFGPFVAGLGFLPVVMRRLGASPEWIAFYLAQNFIGLMLTPVSAMIMPRRGGLVRFGLVCWLLSRGSFLLFAFIPNAEPLILLTLAFWVLESFPVPAYTRIMQAVYPPRARGQLMAIVRVGMAVINLALTPVIGWLLDTNSHRLIFPVLGASAVGASLLFSRMSVDEADLVESAPASAGSLWGLLWADRRFALYLAALTLFGVGLLSGSALLPLVQVDRLHLSFGEIGLLGVVQSAFFLIGYVMWGRVIDRRGGPWALRLIFPVAALIPLSYLAAGNGWMLIPAFAAVGLVNAGVDVGTLTAVIQLSTPERLGEYSALQYTIVGVRGLIAPFIGVWLTQTLGWSFGLVFGLGALLIGLSALILLRVTADPVG